MSSNWQEPTATAMSNMGWQDMVADFHRKMGQPVGVGPGFIRPTRFEQRFDWLEEETTELGQAYLQGDLVGVADALGDLIYVALGTAVEMGIPMDKVFQAIHKANMAKLPAVDGGKVKKPEGWVGPEKEIEQILMQEGM
jgi:predicted HAD superfamily Cof-like phosphohydrolase